MNFMLTSCLYVWDFERLLNFRTERRNFTGDIGLFVNQNKARISEQSHDVVLRDPKYLGRKWEFTQKGNSLQIQK